MRMTGIDSIDTALAACIVANHMFIDADTQFPDQPPRWTAYEIGRLSQMRPGPGSIASGHCGIVSQHVAEHLAAADHYAIVSDQLIGESRRFTDRDADWHGYNDRTRDRAHDQTHCAVLVQHEQQTYMIDFTAGQYGYDAWPLVKRAAMTIEQIARADSRPDWQSIDAPAPKLTALDRAADLEGSQLSGPDLPGR